MNINEIIKGLRCETCTEERVFGRPPNSDADNLYVYCDLSGATRCFCKEHMSYTGKSKTAFLNLNDDWEYVCYGAKLISEILES